MQLISEESIKISQSSLDIADALKKDNVSLKIEAAHAGVMNGNYLFYLPQALRYGSDSLNKFYKPLQKKHYSKTLGYIYNSEYVETNKSSTYYDKIVNYKNPKDLINNVKKYMKTPEYENSRTGFGVLVAKAKLHDKKKILDLKSNDIGTVSVAGDAGIAYCSICSDHVATCGHKLGQRYKSEVCFGVVTDDFEVDHISFETIPANWETNSLIIADSQLLGNIELIEEGKLMNLSLSELKEKMSNIDSVLTELNLADYIEQYKGEVTSALKSQFLLAEDQLLAFNTPLTTYVAGKLLEQLEDSEDKEVIVSLFGTSYEDTFKDKTEDEVKELFKVVETVVVDTAPVVVDTTITEAVVEGEGNGEAEGTGVQLSVADSDKIALAIADQLTATFENSFQSILEDLKAFFTKDQEVKANKILEDQVKAFKEDLSSADLLKSQITEDLKESLINQIILLKNVEKDSEYVSKLKARSVQELKMTLEDHIQLTSLKVEPTKEETPLAVTDANQHSEKADVTTAVVTMEDTDATPTLEITDADKYVEELVSGVEGKLTKAAFSKLYKTAVFEQGSQVAKKLHHALKAQNKI